MKAFIYFILCCFVNNANAQPKNNNAVNSNKGFVKIVFNNVINHRPVVLFDSSYTNPFGEDYVITKFKYYVSNTAFYSAGKRYNKKNYYHLVNQAIDSSLSFTISLAANKYNSIGFLIGVDSARNSSGAQTGPLDPLNDMFWTWNTGYVMIKMEGTSPQSSAVNNKVEYHVGGFKGENNALHYLTFALPGSKQLIIQKGKTSTIIIEVDVAKFWDAATAIKITETPVCSLPGTLAKRIAGNFYRLFKVVDVINEN
jgi:hypothetical protein